MDTGRIDRAARRIGPREGLVALALLLNGLWFSADPVYPLVAVAVFLVPWLPVLATSIAALIASLAYAGVMDPSGVQPGDQALGAVWLLPLALAGYGCVRRRPGWWWLLPFLLAAVPAVFSIRMSPPFPPMWILVGAVVGITRNGDLRTAALRRQEQLTRFLRAERAGLEQRQELARELHDIVGHHVTAIVVLAEAAQARPDTSATTLPRIADTARAALAELDTLVATLRTPGAAGPTGVTRGLADLEDLAGPLREAGVSVSVRVDAGPGLPQALEASAYRIVQEALTNVQRHARASHVTVTVSRDGGWLRLVVEDDGAGLAPDRDDEGRGLLGIAERAQGHGGTSSVADAPGAGTRVRVDLPVRARRRWGRP